MALRIHKTALIDPTAQIGDRTTIEPFAIVGANAIIGNDCTIAAHAVIRPHTRLGAQNHVFEQAVIGGCVRDAGDLEGECFVEIGDRNTFREGVTIDQPVRSGQSTRIGNDNLLMACAHVGADCLLENQIVLANHVVLEPNVTIHSHAFLSGGAHLAAGVRVGPISMVGANARVTGSVLPFCLVHGNPALTIRLNIVGLRRRGFSSARRSRLQTALRTLLYSHKSLTERLEDLLSIESDDVRTMVAFAQDCPGGLCL